MGPIDLNIKQDGVRWEVIGIYELLSDPPDRIPGLSEAMCAAGKEATGSTAAAGSDNRGQERASWRKFAAKAAVQQNADSPFFCMEKRPRARPFSRSGACSEREQRRLRRAARWVYSPPKSLSQKRPSSEQIRAFLLEKRPVGPLLLTTNLVFS